MRYPAYPQYKDSGVQWLGEVPEHWEVKRLSYLALLKSGESITSEQIAEGGDYHVYGGNGLRGKYSAYTHEGSFVLIGRQGALCGNITYATGRFWASEHAVVVNPLETIATRWLGELLYAMNLNQYSVSAAQPGLSVSQIGSLKIPLPPRPEQTAIAAFLDRETGRIDTLVAKKRRLIALLGEKRTALISRTVTRGLPAEAAREFGLEPHTRFKDTGHPWLGAIPVNWDARRLKEISELVGRIGFRGYSTDDLVDEGEGAISMSPSNMIDGVVDLSKCTWLSWEKYFESPEIQIKPGDVVMVKTGSTIGKTAFVENVSTPMTINPQLMIFKSIKCCQKYLFYFVSSKVIQDVIPLHNTGSTIPTMTQAGIGKLPFPLPFETEQTAIATYLDRETATIDQLVAKVEAAIVRLLEYRTALITAAVTGKIDVRGKADKQGPTRTDRTDLN